MTSIMGKTQAAVLYSRVQEQMLSICFQEICSIYSCVCACVFVCAGVYYETLLYLFNVGGREKRWMHYHLVKYKCRHVVQQRNSNVSWKIYCFCHKILMQDFTKTFRQVVSINETNKQTSIQCTGNTSQQTDPFCQHGPVCLEAPQKYKY